MKVEIVPYDSGWIAKYGLEANNIRNIIESELIGIFHIGSTAVPGMKARPTVDLLGVVRDINKIDNLELKLKEKHYLIQKKWCTKTRRVYEKDDGSANLMVYDVSDKEGYIEYIAFYEYLKEHPDVAKKYSDIKETLAKKYKNDLGHYSKEKRIFMEKIRSNALLWYYQRGVDLI